MADSPPSTPIAFFAHERGDARVMKRIAAFQAQGREVIGFTFHRERDKVDAPPTWENIHLGTTYNRRYFQRLWMFALCIGILWRHRARLRGCGVMYVINTDNAMLALLGRFFAGRRVPLVLELADIQPAMVGDGMLSRVLRAAERFVLTRSALLVTTSPGFVRHYFQPVQRFTGEVFLLENKVYPSDRLPATVPGSGAPVENGRPWVIGCFGAMRCRRTLLLMNALALRLGDRVRFVLRGYPSGTIIDDFPTLLGKLPNVCFGGPYAYPDDLAGMYSGVDLSWAFDETDPNGNSAWLLPNRIYEGGCFAVPAIAAAGTETGRWIERNDCGWTFAEPLEESLAEFFATLTPDEWRAAKEKCALRPRDQFTGEADYARLDSLLAGLRDA